MKRLIAAAIVSVFAIFGFAGAAAADPSVSVCHSVQITVNGSDVVNDSACNTAP